MFVWDQCVRINWWTELNWIALDQTIAWHRTGDFCQDAWSIVTIKSYAGSPDKNRNFAVNVINKCFIHFVYHHFNRNSPDSSQTFGNFNQAIWPVSCFRRLTEIFLQVMQKPWFLLKHLLLKLQFARILKQHNPCWHLDFLRRQSISTHVITMQTM